jgi:hypothetical protein
MAVDFSALVLVPCENTFARPITVNPVASMPGGAAYAARGIWTIRNIDIALEDGGILSSDTLTLGVRLLEFPVEPIKGDQVYIPAHGSLTEIGVVTIDDTDDDGQGGSVWTLKKT